MLDRIIPAENEFAPSPATLLCALAMLVAATLFAHLPSSQPASRTAPMNMDMRVMGDLDLSLDDASLETVRRDSPREECAAAIAWAEQSFDLPRGLVAAIALTESGINALAIGTSQRSYFPESRDQAVLQTKKYGRNFAAGCMQLYWRWHAASFASVTEAFDPSVNVRTAVDFLLRLRESAENWHEALAAYHGGSERVRKEYVCRVYAKLAEIGGETKALGKLRCDKGFVAKMRARAREHVQTLENTYVFVRSDG